MSSLTFVAVIFGLVCIVYSFEENENVTEISHHIIKRDVRSGIDRKFVKTCIYLVIIIIFGPIYLYYKYCAKKKLEENNESVVVSGEANSNKEDHLALIIPENNQDENVRQKVDVSPPSYEQAIAAESFPPYDKKSEDKI